MAVLSMDQAADIARRAFEEGRALDVLKMTVVVTDAGGHIRVAMRGDGVGTFGVKIALGKCVTALGFNRSSLQLGQAFSDPAKVAALGGVTGGQFLPLGGGVVVTDAAGEVLGAAAVAGSTPENDHEIITSALAALGLSVLA